MSTRSSGPQRADVASGKPFTVASCAVALRDDGPSTIARVARLTGLSRPTVETAVVSLVARGLVYEEQVSHAATRSAGRPARIYRFNSQVGYVAGIDVGSHSVKVVLADASGRVVGWDEGHLVTTLGGPDRLKYVERILKQCLEASAVPMSKLLAIGVAVTGLVGVDGRLVVSRNLADWEGLDVAANLETTFGCSVVVDNDIRLAALAETRLGAARLVSDVVYLFIGHRISMGLILGGKIRRGRHSAAGEVGDIAFSVAVNEVGELIWTSATTAEQVFAAAENGDGAAVAEVDRFVQGLSVGIATIAMSIDPDVVIIGGGLSRAGEAILQPLRRAVNSRIPVPVEPNIVGSELGSEPAVLGALALAFSYASETLFEIPGMPEPYIDRADLPALTPAGATS